MTTDGNDHIELDPTEEVGPELSEALPQDTEFPPNEGGQQHEQVQFMEELSEAYEPEPIVVAAHPDDGLPYVPEPHAELAIAPPFTYENMVCVEDARKYVEVFIEDDGALIRLQNFNFTEPGSGYDKNGNEKDRLIFDSNIVEHKFGRYFTLYEGQYRQVRPIRPQCKHYKRQMFLNDDEPDATQVGNKIVFRNCAIRTSVGGASMSLRDQAVLACEWRSPPDPETTKRHLDIFDQEKLNSNAVIKKIPLFGNKD